MHPLRQYRKKYKLPARVIAEGVSAQGFSCDVSYIYHIEAGRVKPGYEMAKALSAATHGEVDTIELLEFSNAA